MAQAASGLPNRFITLTVNPQVGDDPESRLLLLTRAWRVIIQRLRRQHVGASIEYLAVVEATKAGEPHLHILYRGPYIPQNELSEWMDQLAGSPIVDIRAIKGTKQAVAYVTKYVGKEPAQFGHAKPYWLTQHYELSDYEKPDKNDPNRARWRIDSRPLWEIVHEWVALGYAPRRDSSRGIVAFRILGQAP